MRDKPTAIALFCGAGGMSVGFEEAGFSITAAIDYNQDSLTTFAANHSHVPHVLKRDLSSFKPVTLGELIRTKRIDTIIGGPPCQGFSLASMNPNAGANFGTGSSYDPRNSLYLRFLKFVNHFRPRAFVMENVLGLRYRSNGQYIEKVKRVASEMGYQLAVWDLVAADFGVPQKRRRVFVVGTEKRHDLSEPLQTHFPRGSLVEPFYLTTSEAIMDLPELAAGEGATETQYDADSIERFENGPHHRKEYARWAREGCEKLTWHVARHHSDRDLAIFKRIPPGTSSAQLSSRDKMLIPYSMNSFADKYRRQPIDEPASTVTAHLSKDGLCYIHPTQNRSLTPREAARLQSFRDKYEFHGTRTSVFRQIGNAVPPVLAEAIAARIMQTVFS